MKCELCHGTCSVYRMACGHVYHIDCLKTLKSNWTINCSKCRSSLLCAHHDGSHWYLGVNTENRFVSMFSITDESKVVTSDKEFSHWRRRNGRLLRSETMSLECNICVS